MPTCRMCRSNYPRSQFVSGNGPRYQVCVRCALDHDLATPEEVPQLYSDELVKQRFTLFGRRYRPWIAVLSGWLLYNSFGRGIELWSNLFLATLIVGTLATPVLHYLGTARFGAELSKLTP